MLGLLVGVTLRAKNTIVDFGYIRITIENHRAELKRASSFRFWNDLPVKCANFL